MLGEIEYTTLPALGVVGSDKAVVALCEQGSAEWFGLRGGNLTASNADLVVTSQGKAASGQTRQTYINSLIAERLLHAVEMGHSNPAMERGTFLEPKARDWYAFVTGRDVKQVGFVYGNESRRYGCSPDGLCSDRLLEIKCPMHKTMIGDLLRGKVPTGYLAQINFQMWTCQVPLLDFVLFTPEPEIPSVIWTVEADPAMQAAFAIHVPAFLNEVEEGYKAIMAMGDVE